VTEHNTDTQHNSGGERGGEQTSFLDTITNDDLKSNDLITGYFGEEGTGIEGLMSDFVGMKSDQPVLPDSPNAYEINLPEGTDEFVAQGYNEFRPLAHELGLSQDTLNKLVEFDQGRLKAAHDRYNENLTKVENELKTEFGDKYDEVINKTSDLFQKVFGEDLANDPIVANDPRIVRGMQKLLSLVSEDKLVHGGLGPNNTRQKDESGRGVIKYKDM